MSEAVVITGMGLVTPVGIGVAKAWQNLCAGHSGIRRITRFDTADYAAQIAGEIDDFGIAEILSPKDIRTTDRFIQLGLVAAHEALTTAGLLAPEAAVTRERMGVLLGSGIGGLSTIEEGVQTLQQKGPRRLSPYYIPSILINLLPGQVALHFGLRGPNLAVVSACATGAHAIGEALQLIKRGVCEVVLAGGAEAPITPTALAGFGNMRALATQFNANPTAASRPFDEARDGFVMGEGAGVVVLESARHAAQRGAKAIVEVAGYGLSGDAYNLTLPDPTGRGVAAAMTMALQEAGVAPAAVGYVNAHATSTPAGDQVESATIARVLGPQVLVSATKSMTGHLLGAAGSVEAIITALALQHQVIPPTINLQQPSAGCTLDYVPHVARPVQALEVAMSNSFGFGGTNAALLLRQVRA